MHKSLLSRIWVVQQNHKFSKSTLCSSASVLAIQASPSLTHYRVNIYYQNKLFHLLLVISSVRICFVTLSSATFKERFDDIFLYGGNRAARTKRAPVLGSKARLGRPVTTGHTHGERSVFWATTDHDQNSVGIGEFLAVKHLFPSLALVIPSAEGFPRLPLWRCLRDFFREFGCCRRRAVGLVTALGRPFLLLPP